MKRTLLLALLALVAPVALQPALAQSAGYRIQPGDQLAITVLEDDTLNRTALVLPDGQISVPLAGSIRAEGTTVEAVEKVIADRLASNFAVRPSVFVSVIELAEEEPTFPIFVMGEVENAGRIDVEAGTTLLQAVALAGGPGRFAATKRIQLRRMDAASGQEKLYLFNYRTLERGGSLTSMITLREGDVLIVPERRLFE